MAGMPFDMSALQNVLNDPSVAEMAKQLAENPAFKQMTEQLQGAFGPGAAGAGAAGAAGASSQRAADGGPPAGMPDMEALAKQFDSSSYMSAMQQMMSDPSFAKMAEDIGKKMFEQDPQLSSMVQGMQNPEMKTQLEQKMKELKDDPELAPILEELETGGPSAMMKYWQDPEAMAKLGKAFQGMPGLAGPGMFPGMAGNSAVAGARDAEAEEAEEEEEEEETIPLLAAAMEGDVAALERLQKEGGAAFDVDVSDAEGRTALHFACGYGEIKFAEALFAAKASINCVDNNQNTPLHYAAGYGEEECVKLLLKHGASLTDKNDDDKTPLEVAKMNEQEAIAKVLEEHESGAFL